MRIQVNKVFYNLAFQSICGLSFLYIPNVLGNDIPNHSLPIKNIENISVSTTNKLLPVPIGDIDSASKKVESERNPFEDPTETEFISISSINNTLKFKGLVKANEKVMAIIENDSEQKLYSVGDTLNNGFMIKSISIKNTTVDISNGFKNYRLSLTNLKNAL
tara:strand:+ start:625 stop:1110 length:486 start_codon:yes stop_codon:yes gene_type:complete